MKASLNWVKDALSSKDLRPELNHYLVRHGMIHATDGRMVACHPFPTEDELFCVSGPEFEKLLARLEAPIELEVEDDHIVLKHGRLRGKIKTLPPDEWQFNEVKAAWYPVPKLLLPSLKKLRAFISDNATKPWALCVGMANDTLYATNNISIAACPEIGLPDGLRGVIPYWAIDFILSRPEGLAEWAHADNYLGFRWKNGAWMRTQLVEGEFPPQVEAIIGSAGYAEHKITDEWRAAYMQASSLLDDALVLKADHMTGINRHMEVRVEATSPLPPDSDHSGWSVEYLNPVIACATHWQPDKWPNPVPFRGEDILGVVMGRRV